MDDRTVDGPTAPRAHPHLFDRDRRDQYLAFGYVAELGEGDPLSLLGAWSRSPRRDERSVSESGLVREGVRALRATFEEAAARAGGDRPQVVFLSGGLDSRAILGGLLEVYGPGEVLAATFGMPGEQDFDYAAQVAAAAGVRHEVLETFSVDWTTQSLVDSVLAREVPLPHPFGQRYLSYHLHQRIGADHAFWDGLCGDAVSGAHLPRTDGDGSWEQAAARFLGQQVVAGSEEHTSPGFQPRSALPAAPLCGEDVLSYADQLDLAVRQARYIGTRRLRGYTVHTPFLSGVWLDFMLSVPLRHRHDQRLYRAIQHEAHPRLFALPGTTATGRRARGPRWTAPARAARRRLLRAAGRAGLRPGAVAAGPSGANDAIRSSHADRVDVREVVLGNLENLARRGLVPGAEPGDLSAAVTGQRLDHRRTSTLLGLELNLKALDRLAGTGAEVSVARLRAASGPWTGQASRPVAGPATGG